MMKYVVVCHGDGDGIIGAACIIKEYRLPMSHTEVIITQPFILDKVTIGDDVKAIFVVDLAINNRDLSMTLNFADKYLGRIVVWADHHQGTNEKLSTLLGSRLLCDETAPSVPAVMLNSGYEKVSKTWVDAANASDRPTEYPATALSERYNNAFKVSLVEAQENDRSTVEKVQRAFLDELLNGEESELITNFGKRYEPILLATQQAAESFRELVPGVGIVMLGDERVDKTVICTAGYEKFPVLVVQFHSLENGEPITMVATNRKDLNLVELFGLPSGPPFRINLPGSLFKNKLIIIEKFS